MRTPIVPLVFIMAVVVATPALVVAQPASTKASPEQNVLLILADDLQVQLGCYGSSAKTPNIDRLAARSVTFERAYCQQALCNPSRSSFLTGLRPDTLGLMCNGLHFRDLKPDVVTLPQAFKANGYATRNVGKVFHNWHTKVKGDPTSWSAPEFLHYATHGADHPLVDGEPPVNRAGLTQRKYTDVPLTENRDVPDAAYFDGRVADEAVRVLNEVKSAPFFLAVGFWKPHAPFNAPGKYWDLYDRAKLPPVDTSWPAGTPDIAFHDGRELRGVPPDQVTFSPEQIAEIRHGYYANISYLDAQVGKVLDALEQSGVAERTVVVFMADHGYHVGEHGIWAKTSNFELDARVPLIISTPSLKQRGVRVASPVELVDLFPTLAELCAVPPPSGLDGRSLVAALDDPTTKVKPGAFTQHPRPAYYDRTPKGVPDAVGYSVRTPQVRYTEWRDWQTGRIVGRELYEHSTDPHETKNAVDAPTDAAAFAEATKLLHAQFSPNTTPNQIGKQ
jgi:iduronate 2-sulfatase